MKREEPARAARTAGRSFSIFGHLARDAVAGPHAHGIGAIGCSGVGASGVGGSGVGGRWGTGDREAYGWQI